VAEINLTDSKSRDASVAVDSAASRFVVRYVDDDGLPVLTARILRGTLDTSLEHLERSHGADEQLAAALVHSDPEVDVERFGSLVDRTSGVYVDKDDGLVFGVTIFEDVVSPDGEVVDRRPKVSATANINTDTPVKWTGRLIPKGTAIRRFVFNRKMQLRHVNGLTYDFLHAMAAELEESDSVLLLGAGDRGNQPLVFNRGGVPYRGFLEGRTRGDAYVLLLHLTNLELKAPPPEDEDDVGS
jgi:hypothetical protein